MLITKVAIIGLGSIAQRHAANIKLLFPQVLIMAISVRGKLPSVALLNIDYIGVSINEVINFQPDFVIVASPATFHFQHVQQLIIANIPLLIEKPITASWVEAQELLALVARFPYPIAVAYCLRFLPTIYKVKNIILQQQLGSIFNIEVHVGQYLPTWRKKDYKTSVSVTTKLGGGVLLELSHELDYLHWLLGDLQFQHAILRNTKILNLEVEEIADLVLTTQAGTICNVHLDFLQKTPQRYCRFIADKGCLHWDLLANQITLLTQEEKMLIYYEPNWDSNNMYLLMLKNFIAQLSHTNSNQRDNALQDAVRVVKLIDIVKTQATRIIVA